MGRMGFLAKQDVLISPHADYQRSKMDQLENGSIVTMGPTHEVCCPDLATVFLIRSIKCSDKMSKLTGHMV